MGLIMDFKSYLQWENLPIKPISANILAQEDLRDKIYPKYYSIHKDSLYGSNHGFQIFSADWIIGELNQLALIRWLRKVEENLLIQL